MENSQLLEKNYKHIKTKQLKHQSRCLKYLFTGTRFREKSYCRLNTQTKKKNGTWQATIYILSSFSYYFHFTIVLSTNLFSYTKFQTYLMRRQKG